MLANTDGNGDHCLDESYSMTLVAKGELVVDYTIIGEGGPVSRVLSAFPCK